MNDFEPLTLEEKARRRLRLFPLGVFTGAPLGAIFWHFVTGPPVWIDQTLEACRNFIPYQ